MKHVGVDPPSRLPPSEVTYQSQLPPSVLPPLIVLRMITATFGIGGIDQVLQQYLPWWAPGLAGVPYIGNFLQNLGQDSAVFGKILVLGLIILFLQWRPAGIFVTRSRSLEG